MRWIAAVLLTALCSTSAARAASNAFQADYVVTVPADDPTHVRVQWRLAGIDEIAHFRLVFRDDRTTDVQGSGQLVWDGPTLRWTPNGPYAHLSYTVAVDRHRPSNGPRFDSHADPDWIATRAWHLFPEINVEFTKGVQATTPSARLIFDLPPGWRSAAAGERLAPNVYRVFERGRNFHRPRGWMLLGKINPTTHKVADLAITVATAPGSALAPHRLLHLYDDIVPLMAAVLGPPPPRVLVVSAPDPMWHGGLSGEESFFVNGRIPLRSADRTSTYLHELFHVWAPFDVKPDGHWVSEGLAEYYTVVLGRRAGRLTDADVTRAFELFRQHGRWNVDLSHDTERDALNNSAPYLMAALDERIRRDTHGRRRLDDAVQALIADGAVVTTARWQAALQRTAGHSLADFFHQHVQAGVPPPVPVPPAP